MFISKNKVHMHDTDMAGVLYFARQFRFAHDALEEFIESEGMSVASVFHNNDFVFVIVHCEADYIKPLYIGDRLEIHLEIERIGSTSFTVRYNIFRDGNVLVGKAKTVHVTLNSSTREKIPLPTKLSVILQKHLISV